MITRRDALKAITALAAAPVIGLPQAVQTYATTNVATTWSPPPWTMVDVKFHDLLKEWYAETDPSAVNQLLEMIGESCNRETVEKRFKGRLYAKRSWDDSTDYIAIDLSPADYEVILDGKNVTLRLRECEVNDLVESYMMDDSKSIAWYLDVDEETQRAIDCIDPKDREWADDFLVMNIPIDSDKEAMAFGDFHELMAKLSRKERQRRVATPA